jgi:hypothetical protein
MLVHMAEAVAGFMAAGFMAADLEGFTPADSMGADSMGADSMGADSMGADSMGAVFTAEVFTAEVFTVTGSMTVDLEGFAVDLACWDGPTTRIHTDRIIIRTTVTAGANTATHIPGITAPIPPVITLM